MHACFGARSAPKQWKMHARFGVAERAETLKNACLLRRAERAETLENACPLWRAERVETLNEAGLFQPTETLKKTGVFGGWRQHCRVSSQGHFAQVV